MEISEKSKKNFKLYVRNVIFGVEDSLVSTVGLLSGVAVAGVDRETILLIGVILIFVEALSMAAGSFLSEESVQEYVSRNNTSERYAMLGGVIMFGSYFVSGFIPLLPYVIFDVSSAFWISIGLSFLALFILGAWSAKMFKARILVSGLRMLIVGGLAIGIGVFVGSLVN